MLLMCCDNPVLDCVSLEVYNKNLLPGIIKKNVSAQALSNWMTNRYSSNTNVYARSLTGLTFRQGNRPKIDRETRSLSLSDSYWLKDVDSNLTFTQISPYFSDFWKGEGIYSGNAVPTLYLDGYLSKYWMNSQYMYKEGPAIEETCCLLCKALEIPVADIRVEGKGLIVKNFTDPDYMFEPADVSGLINPDDFTDNEILDLYGINGFDMLFIDAVIGNGDRHAGNFGSMRSTRTGDYKGMSKLFDFDHALDTKDNLNDILIKDFVKLVKQDQHKNRVTRFCSIIKGLNTHPMFIKRAEVIMSKIQS